jgi:hypothetical protein
MKKKAYFVLCIASNSCVPRSAPRSQQVGPAHPHDPRTSPRYGRFFSPTSPVEEEIDRFKYPAGQLHVISWFVACSIPPSGPLNERPVQRNERTILYWAVRKIDSLCDVVARGRASAREEDPQCFEPTCLNRAVYSSIFFSRPYTNVIKLGCCQYSTAQLYRCCLTCTRISKGRPLRGKKGNLICRLLAIVNSHRTQANMVGCGPLANGVI